MPNHFHLILSPTGIWQNPVKRGLAQRPEDYPYGSANPAFALDPAPQRLKPLSSAALPQA
jgi:hypothetical protein